jgi:5'-3' exonuclease
MGVPGFFAWLLRNLKENKIIKTELDADTNVDILYLDANCLFHPQCYKVLDHYHSLKDLDKLESKMIRRILNYIDYLINITEPKQVFIAVDGVAPMAKMNQQRKRRYRSVDDTIIRNDIKKKYGKKFNSIWSNATITPGTVFMEKLHINIIDYMNKKKKNGVKIVYSSYHTAGEGEHKILQDIRSKDTSSETYVIYGLDADLIFLALASNRENIYLLREAQHFGNSPKTQDTMLLGSIVDDVVEDLNFVSIDNMRNCINEQFYNILDKKYDKLENKSEYRDEVDFTNDFILISFLLGNDFLPHLPSVDIKNRGMDILIDAYSEVYSLLECNIISFDKSSDKSIYGEIHLNNVFFGMILDYITKYENYYFKTILPKYIDNLDRRKCPSSDPYDVEMWNLENMKDSTNCRLEIDDPIRLGEGEPELWKYRYYEHYYGFSSLQERQINMMCHQYLEGITWVMKYYFEGCPSWDWQYAYSHAPFISDISKYYNSKKIDLNDMKFNDYQPVPPCTQLLSVLPPTHAELLPLSYRKLVLSDTSPIIDFYPVKYELDMINKDMNWKCIPHIPCIDMDRVKYSVKNLKLSQGEKIRNKIQQNYKNYL